MADDQSNEPFCALSMRLLRCSSISTVYDAHAGVQRKCVLTGCIDNPDPGPGSGPGDSAPWFHNKAVRVEIASPPSDRWEQWRSAFATPSAIGTARINAQVEPEVLGGIVEFEPVRMLIAVEDPVFDAICGQAARADELDHMMHAKAHLTGSSLHPQDDAPWSKTLGLVPKDLDVSTIKDYAVGHFEITDVGRIDRLRIRGCRMPQGRDEGNGTYVAIQIIESRFNIRAEWALFHSIRCSGRVIKARGEPYDGAAVDIEFSEFEPDRLDRMPETAFFGEFSYWPHVPDEQPTQGSLSLRLRYLREDARDILVPLLAAPGDGEAVIVVNLVNDVSDLLAASDELRGNVRHYEFEIRRQLTEESS